MSPEQHHNEPPYWNDEQELGQIYFGRNLREVSDRSHIALEHYYGASSETLLPLSQRQGERTYVQSRFLTPAIPGVAREQRVADAQAWWYPAERAVVLWEVLLEPRFLREDPREDLLLRSLWLGYERYLSGRFHGAERLLSTWEDTYTRAEWQGFLTTVGYRQARPAVFEKLLAPV